MLQMKTRLTVRTLPAVHRVSASETVRALLNWSQRPEHRTVVKLTTTLLSILDNQDIFFCADLIILFYIFILIIMLINKRSRTT